LLPLRSAPRAIVVCAIRFSDKGFVQGAATS
jgi:hypothetical protein